MPQCIFTMATTLLCVELACAINIDGYSALHHFLIIPHLFAFIELRRYFLCDSIFQIYFHQLSRFAFCGYLSRANGIFSKINIYICQAYLDVNVYSVIY